MNVLSKTKMMLVIAAVCWLGVFAGCGPTYTSEALLEVSLPSSTVFATPTVVNKDVLESHKMSTLHLILTDEVLAAAACNNDLKQTDWYKAGQSDEVIGRLKKDVKVSAIPRTMFIKVSMTGTRREDLPVVVNTVCDAFITHMKKQAAEQTTLQIANVEKELASLAEKLSVVKKKKTELRKDGPALEDQLSVLNAQQRILTRTITDLEQMAAEAKQALESVKQQKKSGELSKHPEVKYYVDNDPTLRGLRTQQINLETRLEALKKKFGIGHAMVKDLAAQLKEVITKADALEKKLVKDNEGRVIKNAEKHHEAVMTRLTSVGETRKEVLSLSEDIRKKLAGLESLQTEQELIEDKISLIEKRLLELELLRMSEEPVKLRSRAIRASRKTDPK